ncbi:hypothetical protein TWF718_006640 [Orbilia javanica]|uniref:F-box domain-containing protein n=1 Tax=Orbilia javanica TaxID=47235 RepID=A0AAN8RDA3_9PEZI
MLLQLPNELVGAILGHLPHGDLFNVAICSRLLHKLVIPVLYTSIEIPVCFKQNAELGELVPSVDPKLMWLLIHDERKYGKYVQSIRVVSGEGDGASGEEGEDKMDIGDDIHTQEDENGEEGEEGGREIGNLGGNKNEDGDSEEEDENERDDSDDEGTEDGSDFSFAVEDPRPNDEDLTIANQISLLIEIGRAPLTSFKWHLNADISPKFFWNLMEMPGSKLSTLEVLSHGSSYPLPAHKLPEGGLPHLRKLVVQGVTSPHRVAELHYIIRASPGLKYFGFGLSIEASHEALEDSFRFAPPEMIGIGFENSDFGWQEPPVLWLDFMETCIFKHFTGLPLRELTLENVMLTPQLASYLPLDSLRHLSLPAVGEPFDFIQGIDIERIQLETCNIAYNMVGEGCVLCKFGLDLQPGLRHLGFRCSFWGADTGRIDWDARLHYSELFTLPEEFAERQKGTLETMPFDAIVDDEVVTPAFKEPRDFEISSKSTESAEIAAPFETGKTAADNERIDPPLLRRMPFLQYVFWCFEQMPLSGISRLPYLRVLTLASVPSEYRMGFTDNVLDGNENFKAYTDWYLEHLLNYIEDLLGRFAGSYGQNFGLDRKPQLERIFVVGGADCENEVGFEIEWSRIDTSLKYKSRTTVIRRTDAQKSVETKDISSVN